MKYPYLKTIIPDLKDPVKLILLKFKVYHPSSTVILDRNMRSKKSNFN